jgi:hypothetical protein
MAAGYIALGSAAFVLAVNYFAVLPGEASRMGPHVPPLRLAKKSGPNFHRYPGPINSAQERAI